MKIKKKDTHKARVIVGYQATVWASGYETPCFWVFDGVKFRKDTEKEGKIYRHNINGYPLFPHLLVKTIRPLTTVKEVAAMDNWLKEGGRLPKDWSSNKNGT